jgi:hypothetical protein
VHSTILKKTGKGYFKSFFISSFLKDVLKNYERYSIGDYSYSSSHQNIPQYAEAPPNIEVK